MPLRSPVPILYVTDIEKTIRFYCDVLGFRCANRFESWASLQRDSAEIMFSLPNEHLPFEKSLYGLLLFSCGRCGCVVGSTPR
jgi:catechol 2,3-dioxygenase-like lactoylglutathione lyase family enzyme